ncbi:MAG: hypothetical protein AABY68_03215 [Pseudomonadota bacterium]
MKKAALLLVIFLTGCATAVPTWTPPSSSQSLSLVDAQIKPACSNSYCYGFSLEMQNKTDRPVEIDWNRSYYTQAGQTNGGLMAEGVIISQRNMIRAPDVILPNGRYLKTVWPSNFTQLSIGLASAEWINQMLPEGSQGVFITLKQGDREEYVRSEMSMSVSYPKALPIPAMSLGGINLINGDK